MWFWVLRERIKCIIFYSFSKYLLSIGFPPLSHKPTCSSVEEASASRGELDQVSINLNIFLQLSLLKYKQWEASSGSHREGWKPCRGGFLIVEGSLVLNYKCSVCFLCCKSVCVSCLSDDSPQYEKLPKTFLYPKAVFNWRAVKMKIGLRLKNLTRETIKHWHSPSEQMHLQLVQDWQNTVNPF